MTKFNVTCLTLLVILFAIAQPASAQTTTRPFGLPFSAPPGPATWLLGQGYGNTSGAYNYGKYWYAAGQGLHFGLDFSAPCQTPIVAIADGVVDQVDNLSMGSAPHNLSILHSSVGYQSFYGHLFRKPTVVHGQPVKRGDVVALSGDPDLTCMSRPHLHLEIRSLDRRTAYNPAALIDADWPMLASAGSFGRFAKDLYNPDRWQTLADQPETHFGGSVINAYRAAWPPPARIAAPPLTLPAFSAPPFAVALSLSRLTPDGCCSGAWWSPDSQSVRYWDGAANQPAETYAVRVADAVASKIGAETPYSRSPDGRYTLTLSGTNASVTETAGGATHTVATSGTWPRFSPDSKRLLWQRFPAGDFVPGTVPPLTELWIADADGSHRTLIGTQPGGSVAWLDSDRLLLSRREGQTDVSVLSVYTLSRKATEPLLNAKNVRGVSIAPGGAHIVYYLTFQGESSGLYLLETKSGAQPIKLPFFGSLRWRDSDTLIYIPYQPGSAMQFMAYSVTSGQTRALTSSSAAPFSVLGDEWSVSPDGRTIVLWKAPEQALWRVALS